MNPIFFRPRLTPLAALALVSAFLLAGCLAGDGDGPDKPTGPMYRCIGEAPYEGTWEEIIAGIKTNPPICKDGKPVDVAGPLHKSAGSADSILIHSYVMDSQCRFITEFRKSLPASDRPIYTHGSWDMLDGNGKPVPSGEYYVNVEVDDGNGTKDTTYQKMGWIANPCNL